MFFLNLFFIFIVWCVLCKVFFIMNLCWFRKKTTRTLYFVLYFVWEGSVWTQMRTGEQKRQKKIQVKTGVNERKGAEWEVRPGWSSDRIKSQRHEMWLNFNEEKHVRKWHRKKWTKGPPDSQTPSKKTEKREAGGLSRQKRNQKQVIELKERKSLIFSDSDRVIP